MIAITAPITAWTMPDDRDAALAAILAQMQACTATWDQRMYGFTHPAIAQGILEMFGCGRGVRLLLDDTQSHGKVEAALLHGLIRDGFPVGNIRITTSIFHEFAHSKEAVIDAQTGSGRILEGSLNFSPTAFKQDNTLLLIESPALARDAAQRFQTEWDWATTNEQKLQTLS